jgi:cytochrome c oxidase subunit 1
MSFFDYTDPALANEAVSVVLSAIGGFILVASGILFLVVLIRSHLASPSQPEEYRFALAVHPTTRVPAALNSYGLWVGLMVALTITNYGYPILQLAIRNDTSVPAVYVGER